MDTLCDFVPKIGLGWLISAAIDLPSLPRERRFRKTLDDVGRTATVAEIVTRSRTAGGTAIVDAHTLDGNAFRLWWTSENVLAESPNPPPDAFAVDYLSDPFAHPFDKFVFDHYLHRIRGRAVLVTSWNSAIAARHLYRACPEIPAVRTWSAKAEYFASKIP